MMSTDYYTQLNQLNLLLIEYLSKMLEILRQEHDVLAENDQLKITDIAQAKQQLGEEITRLQQQHHQLQQAQNNHASTANGPVQAINPVARDFEINRDRLTQLSQQCADQNQVNGIIMQNMRRHVEMQLAILRGQTLPVDSYTAHGTQTANSENRVIAQV